MNLDDLEALAEIDPHDARRALAEFPAQCRRASTLRAAPPPGIGAPRVVVVAGMGGPAARGDLPPPRAAHPADVPGLPHRGPGPPPPARPGAPLTAGPSPGDTARGRPPV